MQPAYAILVCSEELLSDELRMLYRFACLYVVACKVLVIWQARQGGFTTVAVSSTTDSECCGAISIW